MEDKWAKFSKGILVSLLILIFSVGVSGKIALAEHEVTEITVTPSAVDTNQRVKLNFTIKTDKKKIWRTKIYLPDGWSDMEVLACPDHWNNYTDDYINYSQWYVYNSSYQLQNISVEISATSPPFAVNSSWKIRTYDSEEYPERGETTYTNVSVYLLSSHPEISSNLALVDESKTYILTLNNTGQDNITEILGNFSGFNITACTSSLPCTFENASFNLSGILQPSGILFITLNTTAPSTPGNMTLNLTSVGGLGGSISSILKVEVRTFFPAPNITLNFPENSFYTNNNTPEFGFTANSSISEFLTCELFIDGGGYGKNSSVLNNTLTVMTADHSVGEGEHSWFINCSDEYNSVKSEVRIIHIDAIPPVVTINKPKDGSTTYDTTPTLSVSVSEPADIYYRLDDEPITYVLCRNCTSKEINISEEYQDDYVAETSSQTHVLAQRAKPHSISTVPEIHPSIHQGGLRLGAIGRGIAINEIMYNPTGTDKGHEWIEIYNNVTAEVNLTDWKFYEDETNHELTLKQGSWIISAGGYAVIADNASQFLLNYSDYTGTLFDSSFSLSNTGETIAIKNNSGSVVDSVNYSSSWGADGNGYSLERIDPSGDSNDSENWQNSSTLGGTPGAVNTATPTTTTTSTTTTSTTTSTTLPQIPSGSGYTKLLLHFNGDAVDYSGYGNNGTIHEAGFVDGKFGQGLEFDGVDDYVEIPDSESLDITQEITIEAWVKVNDFGDWEGIVTKGTGTSPYSMQIWGDGALRFTANWGSPPGGSGGGSWNSNTKMYIGQWYHVAVTYDGSKVRFYINGEKDTNEVMTAITFGTNNEILTLGCDFPGGDEYFDGTIDEVRILNRSLTPEEIRADYGLPEGNHTITVYAKDRAGNIGQNSTNFTVQIIPECDRIELKVGEWEYVSVPLVLNETMDEKGELFGEDVIVQFYNTTSQDLQDLSSTDKINPGYGYKAMSTVEDKTIILKYKESAEIPAVELKEGWNLIGLMSRDETQVAEALWSLYGSYPFVYSPRGEGEWDRYIVDGIHEFDMMKPTVGYWIFMNKGGIYNSTIPTLPS